jgi:branched-chain amino acid transport system permease protein
VARGGRPRFAQIAGLGMSRSFQHVRLLPRMTVLENVAIGAHLRGQRGVLSSMLRLDRQEEARILAEAARQIERVGLKAQMYEQAGALALGQQRILEIARALAADPACCCWTSRPPACAWGEAGPGRPAAQAAQRGHGDPAGGTRHGLRDGLVDRIVVMEFGQKIAEGLPEEIQNNPPCWKPIWEEEGDEEARMPAAEHIWAGIEVRDLSAAYGRVQVLSASTCRWSRARSSP